ncbi:MAG: hypothetical protein E5W98_00690 [Mesorhizobium sp.]|nr:MAG: hypothetical protein E5W98_00690 [Mesorhizobium sp.]
MRSAQDYDRSAAAKLGLAAVVGNLTKSGGEIEIVVTKKVPPYAVVAGNPARIIQHMVSLDA